MTGKNFPQSRFFPLLRAMIVGGLVLSLFLTMTESLPLVWDEGDSMTRADSVLFWGESFLTRQTPTSGGEGDETPPLLSEGTLQKYFPNTVTREGHPAGYVIVIATGKAFCDRLGLTQGGNAGIDADRSGEMGKEGSSGFLSEKGSYRFGPIFLWGLALAATFYRLEKRFSLSAAIGGVLSILLLPRIFVHAQIAFGDSVMISGWLLTWAFFDPALEKKRYSVIWGGLLGFTAAAKFSGALAAIPFAGYLFIRAWRERSFRRTALRVVGIAFPTAVVVFYLLNPPIWRSPLSGFATYLYLNTHRGAYNIAIQFLGRIYNLDHPLPWWNPLFWTAVTIPTGLLLSGVIVIILTIRNGILSFRRGGDPDEAKRSDDLPIPLDALLLLTANWAVLIVVRMIPGLPVHDGIRLFAPSFPFFGILAGIGLARLWSRGVWGRIVTVAVFVGSASSLFLYFPQGLSYYNLLIGGLPGATRRGMEATYYWDALDRGVIEELTRITVPDLSDPPFDPPSGRESPVDGTSERSTKETATPPVGVLFSAASYGTLTRARRWEGWPFHVETITRLAGRKDLGKVLTSGNFRYYVLQNRGGGLTSPDRWLLENKKPVWVKTAGCYKGFSDGIGKFPGSGAWDLTASPLIAIYPMEDFITACRMTAIRKLPEKTP